MRESAMISFDKVRADLNTKIMLDCTRIANGTESQVYQSENRNVITIVCKGFYYHVTLNDILNSLLSDDVTCPFCKDDGFDKEGLKNHLEHGDCEVYNNTDISDIKRIS